MSWVDAFFEREKDKITISERINGERFTRELSPAYEFYYKDQNGSFIATTGERCSKFVCKNGAEFRSELKNMGDRKTFEADHNVVFKTLKRNFQNPKPADLHVAFLDIEVDFDLIKGYSTPEDPFNPVTAISVYCQWLEELFTLVIAPETLTDEEAQKITDEFPNTLLCKNEKELLMLSQDLIEDADVVSGWNSTGYDIPYMINRTIRLLGKSSVTGWCLWGKHPVKRKYEQFGKERSTYDLVGRLHLDYLDLYKKHTPKTQESYKLDFIGEQEVGEKKVEYEGTLYQLYREDFKKFIEYNRQDTLLLDKLDKKLKFIDLANQIAVQNWVLMPSTMGTVAWVDQAIINEAHSRSMVVPTKIRDAMVSTSAAGAWVADPVEGLHDWIGAVDINSLYPSCIRFLNMSPETILAQIRDDYTSVYLEEKIERENLYVSVKGVRQKNYTEAWNGLFGTLEYNMVMQKTGDELILDFADGSSTVLTAAEVYEMVFSPNSGMNISGNGTIFRTDRDGLIPGLLARWYAERASMKTLAGELKNIATDGLELSEEMIDEVKKFL